MNTRVIQLVAVIACCLFAIEPVNCKAAVIAGYDPGRHDRFFTNGEPNTGFFLDENLLTGVALSRAVLITPQHYIVANHAGNSSPTFRGADGTLHTYNSAGSLNLTTTLPDGEVVGSDFRVHRLAAPISSADGVTPMALLGGGYSNLIGETFAVLGQDSQAGLNVIDEIGIVEFTNGSSDSYAFRYSFDTLSNGGTGGLGADEAGLIQGDSGNSALIDINGELVYLGSHFGIDVPAGSSPGAGDQYDSYSTLVTPYLDQINTFVMADGQSLQLVTAVPEPFALPFVLCVGSLFLFRRRRD